MLSKWNAPQMSTYYKEERGGLEEADIKHWQDSGQDATPVFGLQLEDHNSVTFKICCVSLQTFSKTSQVEQL